MQWRAVVTCSCFRLQLLKSTLNEGITEAAVRYLTNLRVWLLQSGLNIQITWCSFRFPLHRNTWKAAHKKVKLLIAVLHSRTFQQCLLLLPQHETELSNSSSITWSGWTCCLGPFHYSTYQNKKQRYLRLFMLRIRFQAWLVDLHITDFLCILVNVQKPWKRPTMQNIRMAT